MNEQMRNTNTAMCCPAIYNQTRNPQTPSAMLKASVELPQTGRKAKYISARMPT